MCSATGLLLPNATKFTGMEPQADCTALAMPHGAAPCPVQRGVRCDVSGQLGDRFGNLRFIHAVHVEI
jgi:hypothetical protein